MNSAYRRRKIILDFMADLDGKQVNCSSCEGTCCTFQANSMQITPLEVIEILAYLRESNQMNDSLKDKLKSCVLEYRLDIEIPTSRGRAFRKTYTCPFFTEGPRGCSLPKEVNPYGCLGFNPKNKGAKGGTCGLKEDLAEFREIKFATFENDENQRLKEKYKLCWDKLNIPQALLSLWGKISI